MSQSRFHNYRRPLQSFAENLRMLGFIQEGVYAGFDAFTIQSGTNLLVNHLITGLVHTKQDGSADVPRGVVMSRQGTVVHEDAAVAVSVNTNSGNAFPRIDVLVLQHSYIDTPGGAAANYSIIQGANGGAVEPPLSNTLIQTKVGRFIVPANAVDHTLTSYEKAPVKKLGGQYAFGKANESDVLGAPSTYSSDFNLLLKSGPYFITTTLNRPSTVTPDWFVIVMSSGVEVAQLAQAKTSGRIYSRAYNSGTQVWSPWVNLNNPDVEVAVSDLQTAIGNRLYSEENYVNDLESLTASIDSLDVALKVVSDALTVAQTDINNLETAVIALKQDALQLIIDGGGVPIVAGARGFIVVPFNCIIKKMVIIAEAAGSVTVDIWKDTYANHPPTDPDSITAAAPPTLASASKNQDATLTGWTTVLNKFDHLGYNVDVISGGLKFVTISLEVEKTW